MRAFVLFFLPDAIFEKFKGPCGHDNPSCGASAPNHFCRMSFLRNSKAPAGMTTRCSGLCPRSFFPDTIFEKLKGPCGHDNPSFGASAPNHFCQDSWQSQMLSTGWPAGRPILILFPPFINQNLGRDQRSGSIRTTPRSGILTRVYLDRSQASKQP